MVAEEEVAMAASKVVGTLEARMEVATQGAVSAVMAQMEVVVEDQEGAVATAAMAAARRGPRELHRV